MPWMERIADLSKAKLRQGDISICLTTHIWAGKRSMDQRLGCIRVEHSNTSWSRFQNPQALTYKFASDSVLADLYLKDSPFNKCRGGSVVALWHTSVRKEAVKSGNSLCLCHCIDHPTKILWLYRHTYILWLTHIWNIIHNNYIKLFLGWTIKHTHMHHSYS